MDASSTAPADDSIAQEAVAAAETLTNPEAAEPPAEEDPSTRVYVFEATTKRVAASGDSFQVVLEMSGAHWLRYVANALHKGTNTLIVKPEQLRWTPPAKAPAFAVCGFDEELQRWVCRESDDAQDEPCAHAVSVAVPAIASGIAREIPLTQGKVAIVDAADYDRLSQYKWHP